MGQHHVPLTFNEDGLVTSVGNQQTNDIYETCVSCGCKTNVKITTHIDYRYGYVEGNGQYCKECYDRVTGKSNNDYITRVMKNRTTLVTITAEDILNTPNDMELGAKVRQMYWEIYGEPKPETMTCSLCGGDTSNVDYDYLSGTDHISCILSSEMKS